MHSADDDLCPFLALWLALPSPPPPPQCLYTSPLQTDYDSAQGYRL